MAVDLNINQLSTSVPEQAEETSHEEEQVETEFQERESERTKVRVQQDMEVAASLIRDKEDVGDTVVGPIT